MKINSINFSTPIQSAYKKVQMMEETQTNALQKKDSIEISEAGKSLSQMKINNESFDEQKVNDIKSRIQNGTYQIDSRQLAQKIISGLKEEKSQL